MSVSEYDDDIYDEEDAEYDDLSKVPMLFDEIHEGREIKVWRLGTNDKTAHYAINNKRDTYISSLVMYSLPTKISYN